MRSWPSCAAAWRTIRLPSSRGPRARSARSTPCAFGSSPPRDLGTPPTAARADGGEIEPVELASGDGRMIMRHSAAHVLAQAVQDLFPGAKLGIGPPIENGFYYDFDVAHPFGPDDLKKIEARMRAIVRQGQRFSRRAVSDGQARAALAGEPYKLELIRRKGGGGRPPPA